MYRTTKKTNFYQCHSPICCIIPEEFNLIIRQVDSNHSWKSARLDTTNFRNTKPSKSNARPDQTTDERDAEVLWDPRVPEKKKPYTVQHTYDSVGSANRCRMSIKTSVRIASMRAIENHWTKSTDMVQASVYCVYAVHGVVRRDVLLLLLCYGYVAEPAVAENIFTRHCSITNEVFPMQNRQTYRSDSRCGENARTEIERAREPCSAWRMTG